MPPQLLRNTYGTGSKILTKMENILTHWSAAQAGLNDKMKKEVENLIVLFLQSFLFNNVFLLQVAEQNSTLYSL